MMKAFLRSLIVTSALSFVIPLLFIGLLVTSLVSISYLPLIGESSQYAMQQVLAFLAAFGNGDPVEGTFVIGFTCSFVGILFDTYASYSRYLRGDS